MEIPGRITLYPMEGEFGKSRMKNPADGNISWIPNSEVSLSPKQIKKKFKIENFITIIDKFGPVLLRTSYLSNEIKRAQKSRETIPLNIYESRFLKTHLVKLSLKGTVLRKSV
jgi:hypothetical protein